MSTFKENFLDFEKNHINNLIKFKINEHHLYPILRWKIITDLEESNTDLLKAHTNKKDIKGIYKKMLLSIPKSIKTINKEKKQKKDILFFSNKRLRNKLYKGLSFDIIYDNLTSISKSLNTVIIESSKDFTHNKPFSSNIVYPEYFLAKAYIKAKIEMKKRQYMNIFKEFCDYIKKNILSFFNKFEINKTHYHFLIHYAINYAKNIESLFKKTKPKLIIINAASYGGLAGCLVRTAKNNSIITAEFQHGAINNNHLAYNYSKVFLANEDFSTYQPDYLLTFGAYWNNNIRTNSKLIPIGHPELSEKIKQYKERKNNNNKKNILIASQGAFTNELVQLTIDLSEKLNKEFKIIYKLHPGEVEFEDRYSKLKRLKNVEIAKTGNIYDFITESDFIVGVTSTTLYEALAFEKPIYILDNRQTRNCFNHDIGIWFNDAEELQNKLNQYQNCQTKNSKYYWENAWKENYSKFLEQLHIFK